MSELSMVRSVRLPRELLDGLAARAQLERRTFNNLVVKILTDALDEPAAPSPAPKDKDQPE